MSVRSFFRASVPYRHIILLLISFVLAWGITFSLGARYKETFLQLKVSSSHDLSLQVFYDLGQGWREEHSQVRRIPASSVLQTVRFVIPRQRVISLRIDPCSDVSRVNFSDIALVDNRNAVLFRFDLQAMTPLSDILEVTIKDGVASVCAAGEDPQFLLAGNHGLANQYGFRYPLWLSLTLVLFAFLWLTTFLLCRISSIFASEPLRCCTNRNARGNRSACLLALIGMLLSAGLIFSISRERPKGLQQEAAGHQIRAFRNQVPEKRVNIKRSDGLTIAGTLYQQLPDTAAKPAILLLHGNYPEGRNFPMYRVLATELAGKGYIVLTMDFAGYGESGDPFRFGQLSAIDMNLETRAAVEYLQHSDDIHISSLTIVGHSMGADPALSTGISESSINGIVVIGPPRRVNERFHFPPDRDFFWNWAIQVRKKVYGKTRYPDWYSKEVWVEQIMDRDMVHFLPYFSGWVHKPILFIDGERESGPDRRFIQQYYRSSSFPKQYITLNKADHNCNVVSRGRQVVYDTSVMRQLVNGIDQWISDESIGKHPRFTDLLQNFLRWLFAIEVLRA